VGANAYLYGTRFVTYLAREYGIDKLRDFFCDLMTAKPFMPVSSAGVWQTGPPGMG
jgi:hypothetical protein